MTAYLIAAGVFSVAYVVLHIVGAAIREVGDDLAALDDDTPTTGYAAVFAEVDRRNGDRRITRPGIGDLAANPCDWDQTSHCFIPGCDAPACHRLLTGMAATAAVYVAVCCRHARSKVEVTA